MLWWREEAGGFANLSLSVTQQPLTHNVHTWCPLALRDRVTPRLFLDGEVSIPGGNFTFTGGASVASTLAAPAPAICAAVAAAGRRSSSQLPACLEALQVLAGSHPSRAGELFAVRFEDERQVHTFFAVSVSACARAGRPGCMLLLVVVSYSCWALERAPLPTCITRRRASKACCRRTTLPPASGPPPTAAFPRSGDCSPSSAGARKRKRHTRSLAQTA